MLKKVIACVLVFSCLVAIFVACGNGAAPPAPAQPDAAQPGDAQPGDAAPAVEDDGMTARDRVYALIDAGSIRFAGIPPQQLPDRSNIEKGVLGQEPRDNLRIGMSLGYHGAPFFIVMEAEL